MSRASRTVVTGCGSCSGRGLRFVQWSRVAVRAVVVGCKSTVFSMVSLGGVELGLHCDLGYYGYVSNWCIGIFNLFDIFVKSRFALRFLWNFLPSLCRLKKSSFSSPMILHPTTSSIV